MGAFIDKLLESETEYASILVLVRRMSADHQRRLVAELVHSLESEYSSRVREADPSMEPSTSAKTKATKTKTQLAFEAVLRNPGLTAEEIAKQTGQSANAASVTLYKLAKRTDKSIFHRGGRWYPSSEKRSLGRDKENKSPRSITIEFLERVAGPVSSGEIIKAIRKTLPTAKSGTVYTMLNRLVSAGIIEKRNEPSGRGVLYNLRAPNGSARDTAVEEA